MGFSFFSKKVYDEDLCFIRDLISIAESIARLTSAQVMTTVINKIIDKHGLKGKLYELEQNGNYEVQDCYPSDNYKKFNRAADLLKIHKQLSISREEQMQILYPALQCVRNMYFSSDEKIRLIKTCVIEPTGDYSFDNELIQQYLDLI